jgi:hypothetical protein
LNVQPSIQLQQFFQKRFVVRDPLLDEANDSVAIDDIGDASAAELAAYLTSRVGNQWIVDGIFFTELSMGVKIVAADAQYLGIELFKTCDVVLKSL